MASGEAVDQNVDESSDSIHDFPCKPCSDDGKNIEGVNFCAECQTYFCQACIVHHNKCFKTHTLYNKSGIKSGKIQYQQQSGGLACDKHPGNLIQMYCGEHDDVCCAVCIAVDHRLCNSADYIPKLAKEILNGRDRKGAKTSLEEMKEKLHAVKSSKLEQITEVSKEKEDLLIEIGKLKERIIARIEEIEQTSVKQVQDKHKGIVDKIKTDIDAIDAKLRAIDGNIRKINEFKGNNEAKLFVVLSKANEVESGCCKYLENYGEAEYGKIAFEFSQGIELAIRSVESFGFTGGCGFAQSYIDSAVSAASPVGEFVVTDCDSCSIIDCCVLENGQIILADLKNQCLIRFNKEYDLCDSLSISYPKSLCRISLSELVVLDDDAVHFIHVGRSMIPTHSVTINVKESLFPTITGYQMTIPTLSHIVFSDEKLYIVAYNKYYMYIQREKRYQDQYRVVVLEYNIDGSFVRSILTDLKQNIEKVNAFSMSLDSSQMFFAVAERRIITLDSNGKILSEFSEKRLKNVSCVI
ncbi:uncharacterized protein LOC123554016 [Mercenaria mercenaria]|uniref:uncharacterized protein LOC123554016 n=1 Tax=Mercenaria mercenaria TaxID=6596 RepID=UPI00234F9B51|nr:uncharacterized protein LOC123554016 [Mercenaria mercenaria]XP_045199767.2 uncharacterized protein LOC123554016 [Mercenaria mercenaria]